MMTFNEFTATVERVAYRQWRFITSRRDDGYVLQVGFFADGEEWRSRKWLVSEHATVSEVVLTAFKAVLTAEEHEVREHFTVDGVAALNPHLDIEKLIRITQDGELDVRAQ